MPVNSIYWQLANLFFVLAAVFTDIILVRVCLVIGNLLLFLCAALGWPLWGSVINTPYVQIDAMVWSALAFVLHFWALVVLILDAKELAPFEDKNSESLYQYFKNRAGINRRSFLPILTKGRWTRVKTKGTVISADREFHLVVEGYICCEIEGRRRRDDDFHEYKSDPHRVKLKSGDFFDLRLANIFGSPIGFFNTSFAATTACDDVLLFTWDIETLVSYTRGCAVVAQAWRNVIAFSVADMAHLPCLIETETCGTTPGTRNPDFSIPIHQTDRRKSCKEVLWWIIRSADPRPPRGIRQAAVPFLSVTHAQMVMNDPRLSSLPISKV